MTNSHKNVSPCECSVHDLLLALLNDPRAPIIYINRSNLSFFALHTGQISGGSSLAQRYPHTLHRHTGFDKLLSERDDDMNFS